jgi:type IV fimbrial biogenesis protein FimT
MIAVAILGTVVTIALPSFKQMIRNYEVKVASESMIGGLQRARGEAVSRNTTVKFVLGTGTSWTVSDSGGTTIDSRSGTNESSDATLTRTPSAATTVTYNNLGQVVANADASATLTQLDVTASGASTTLRVLIGAGGGARLCDPSLPAYPGNFRGC